MLQDAGPVAWECISNKIRIPLRMFSYQVKSQLLAGYWLLCEIYMWFYDVFETFTLHWAPFVL